MCPLTPMSKTLYGSRRCHCLDDRKKSFNENINNNFLIHFFYSLIFFNYEETFVYRICSSRSARKLLV